MRTRDFEGLSAENGAALQGLHLEADPATPANKKTVLQFLVEYQGFVLHPGIASLGALPNEVQKHILSGKNAKCLALQGEVLESLRRLNCICVTNRGQQMAVLRVSLKTLVERVPSKEHTPRTFGVEMTNLSLTENALLSSPCAKATAAGTASAGQVAVFDLFSVQNFKPAGDPLKRNNG